MGYNIVSVINGNNYNSNSDTINYAKATIQSGKITKIEKYAASKTTQMNSGFIVTIINNSVSMTENSGEYTITMSYNTNTYLSGTDYGSRGSINIAKVSIKDGKISISKVDPYKSASGITLNNNSVNIVKDVV